MRSNNYMKLIVEPSVMHIITLRHLLHLFTVYVLRYRFCQKVMFKDPTRGYQFVPGTSIARRLEAILMTF